MNCPFWLDSLRADAVFAWRQLIKKKTASAAAVLSLALATGACISAFRLVDALLFRPLPVVHPERLYLLSRQTSPAHGKVTIYDGWEYRLFRELRAAMEGRAELIAASFGVHADLTYRSDGEMEKANVQYVSGWMFDSFGLSAASGRLFTSNDDRTSAHPVAVLSYDYWSRRFGRDPRAIGHTFRLGSNHGQSSHADVYQIVGVAPPSFTGTEPGTVSDIFVPVAMNGYTNLPVAAFLRIFVRLGPGSRHEPIYERLRAAYRHAEQEAGGTRWTTSYRTLLMEPAAAGVSRMQKDYRLPLTALAGLVALVLLIACVNVANLMTARAAARSREMALRAAIGGGRLRLMQLVLVESTIIAFLASAIGYLFAAWAAPMVAGLINPPDNPARFLLSLDWRLLAFSLALTFGVTVLFGLIPALRSSAADPAEALRAGAGTRSRRRLMNVLITAQIVFAFLVVFIGGLFVATFDRLKNQPVGFSAERLLVLDTVAENASAEAWEQVARHLRTLPGVERVAMSEWALLDDWGYKYGGISVHGEPPLRDVENGFLSVSPGWLETMRIPLLEGRDFQANDIYLSLTKSGVAIVNQAFARQYFGGEDPVGKTFVGLDHARFQIVGLAGDARYRDLRRPMIPVVYSPFRWIEGAGWWRAFGQQSFLVRTTTANPLALASTLRREVMRAGPGFYVSNIRTQRELVEIHTVRERLLAMLSLFFAAVALLLAGVGIYGVLDYSVYQQRREIGIRMALGARAPRIAGRFALDLFPIVSLGTVAGLAFSRLSVRYIESMLYQVKAAGASALGLPLLAMIAAAFLAALPALIRAVRTDPAAVLRAE